MNAATAPRPLKPALRFRSVALSDVGGRRAVNEDRVLARPEAQLWAIADGMGGHSDGGAAAQRVVDALGTVTHGASAYACLSEIEARIAAVNASLFAERANSGRSGSTLIALLAHEGHVACLWAGDSRAYRLRGRRLERLSRDHSIVQGLIDAGALSEADRRGHPQTNVITRAVGADRDIMLERRFVTIEAGDRLLLCSDGLTVCIEDEEIAVIATQGTIEEATERLLAIALDRGAPDNVSLILIETHQI